MPLPQSPTQLSAVGGVIQNAIQPRNTSTDLDARFGNISRMECAMLTNTGCLAIVPIIGGTTTFNAYRAQWKSNLSNAVPVVTLDASTFLITFPETVLDEMNNQRSLAFTYGQGAVLENWGTRRCEVEIVNSYTARARVYDLSGNLQTDTDCIAFIYL